MMMIDQKLNILISFGGGRISFRIYCCCCFVLAQVAERIESGLVIGCDTIVTKDGRIFEKPSCPEEARAMLSGALLPGNAGIIAIVLFEL